MRQRIEQLGRHRRGQRKWSRAVFILQACCLLWPSTGEAQLPEVRRVLVFYELGLASPAVAEIDQEIRAALDKSPYQIELYREYLETTLFPMRLPSRSSARGTFESTEIAGLTSSSPSGHPRSNLWLTPTKDTPGRSYCLLWQQRVLSGSSQARLALYRRVGEMGAVEDPGDGADTTTRDQACGCGRRRGIVRPAP